MSIVRGRSQQLMSERLAAVRSAIERLGVAMPAQIQAETGLKSAYLGDLLTRLVNRGEIERVQGGYRLTAGQ